MKTSLRRLLDRLDEIAETHDELFDSEVRGNMGGALFDGYVRGESAIVPRFEFGMFTEEAERAVREAIQEYLSAATKRAKELGITTFHGRLAALQDPDVRSAKGNDYDEFFGHCDPKVFDENGNVISPP